MYWDYIYASPKNIIHRKNYFTSSSSRNIEDIGLKGVFSKQGNYLPSSISKSLNLFQLENSFLDWTFFTIFIFPIYFIFCLTFPELLLWFNSLSSFRDFFSYPGIQWYFFGQNSFLQEGWRNFRISPIVAFPRVNSGLSYSTLNFFASLSASTAYFNKSMNCYSFVLLRWYFVNLLNLKGSGRIELRLKNLG